MNSTVIHIAFPNLVLILIPIGVVALIYLKWSLSIKTVFYATARMVLQLVAIGFLLVFIFQWQSPWAMAAILSAMLLMAGWIAIRPVKDEGASTYSKAMVALLVGCISVLMLVVFGVLRLEPWYEPRYLIPIAGMIFANAMNSVSLAAERVSSEINEGKDYVEARNRAFGSAMIPILNSFFAVGLVSLPGMMTGQILSGVSPLVAVRYQMMVMGMLLGASGISTALFLQLSRRS